ELFEVYLDPRQRLARALGEGFKRLTEDGYIKAASPLIVILDTYEIIDRVDFWIRLVIRASGPRVIWIICGRDNLTRSRQFGEEYFKGYADEWPRRLYSWDLNKLAQDDVKKYFAVEAPAYPIDETEIERISRATRGIPLAIREAAEMLRKGISVDEIV